MLKRVILILMPIGFVAWAGPQDADRSESTFRQYWADRFTTFSQEQNVPGFGARPDGTPAIGGKKNRANKDDGFQYEGYLTYHDMAFDTFEEVSNQGSPKTNAARGSNGLDDKETRTLYGFISPHGGLSAAGGSSLLERIVYQQHEKFMKEQEETRKNGKPVDDEKTGTSYKSVFQVDTQKVFKDPNAKPSAAKPNTAKPDDPEPEKVERWRLRSEVKTEVEKVGEEASKTVEAAARGRGSEGDENALANSTLLYEAAGRAYDAWWNSTQSNLAQLRTNRAVRRGPEQIKAQLQEDVANCDEWASQTRVKLKQSDNAKPAAAREKDDKEIDRMLSQCKEMVRTSYKAIDPSFERDENDPDGGEKLSNGGSEKENARERDLRVQLEVLADPQKTPSEVTSNWNYSDSDAKSKVTISFDEDGRKPVEVEMTGKEQVESYNEQLKSAAAAYEEVKKRLPVLKGDANKILQYQIKDRRSAKEISALPDEIYEADAGVAKPQSKPIAKTYQEVLTRKTP